MMELAGSESTLVAAICGLCGALAWGLADFLGAVASKSNTPAHAAGAVQIIGAALFVLIYFVALRSPVQVDCWGAGYAAGGGIFIGLGLLSFYKALEIGPISVVCPLGSAYPLVTTPVAVALFAAELEGLQLVGIGLTVIGVTACAGIAEAKHSETRLTRGVRFGAVTLLCWGFAFALLDQGVDRLDWETCALIQLSAAAGTFIVLFGWDRRWWVDLPRLVSSPYILGAGVLMLAGALSVNLGLSGTGGAGVAIVTATSSCYPALTIVLAIWRLGERIQVASLCGALLTTVGVVVLSVA